MKRLLGILLILIGLSIAWLMISRDSYETSVPMMFLFAAGMLCFWAGLFMAVFMPVGDNREALFLASQGLATSTVFVAHKLSFSLSRHQRNTVYYIAFSEKNVRIVHVDIYSSYEKKNEVTLPISAIYAAEVVRSPLNEEAHIIFNEIAPAWVQNLSNYALRLPKGKVFGSFRRAIPVVKELATANGIRFREYRGWGQQFGGGFAFILIAIIIGTLGYVIWFILQ